MNQQTDMRPAIIAKSDQMNAEDLIAGPRTITITDARVSPGTEQPVIIKFQGDDGKPYKPCKSMCRVMVHAWGADSSKYAGQSMTLYNDPSVKWGGVEIGGIRISHMTGIDKKMQIPITMTRGSKKIFTVMPLDGPQNSAQSPDDADQRRQAWLDAYISKVEECKSLDELAELQAQQSSKIEQIRDKYPDHWTRITDAHSAAYSALSEQ